MSYSTVTADCVALLHAGVSVFLLAGFIWIGFSTLTGWKRPGLRFHGAHLAVMLVILGRLLLGLECPLSALEDSLLSRGEPHHFGPAEIIFHKLAFRGMSRNEFELGFLLMFALNLFLYGVLLAVRFLNLNSPR